MVGHNIMEESTIVPKHATINVLSDNGIPDKVNCTISI